MEKTRRKFNIKIIVEKTLKGDQKSLFVLLANFLFGLVCFCNIFAAGQNLAITEIMYNPQGSDGGNEWIEVKNVSGKDLEIGDDGRYKDNFKLLFRMCDKQEKGQCEKDHPVYYDENVFRLGDGELFIITSDIDNFKENHPQYDGKVLESNFNLTNGEDNFIGIFGVSGDDAGEGEQEEDFDWLDELSYGSGWGGNGNGKTLERVDSGEKNSKDNWTESFYVGGTPGKDYEKIEIEFSDKVYVNELIPDPEGSDQEGEWIEFYNSDSEDVDLLGWAVKDSSGKQYFFEDIQIGEDEYFVLKYEDSKISLNNGGDEIILLNPSGERADGVSYGKVPSSGQSWARRENGEFNWTPMATPGGKNEFPTVVQYPSEIFFNEILPNPDGADKGSEWVEFYNGSNKQVNLEEWIIENRSGRKYIIGQVFIDGNGLAVIELKNTSFAIRNSNEVLRLIDPNGDLVSQVSYVENAKSGISFNKNKEGKWLWSRFLTPGEGNVFNNSPQIKIEKDKEIFKDVRAYFSAEKTRDKDGDELKFKWDFGDGHKSYLAGTSHVFEERGEFNVVLVVNDGSEEVMKTIKIEVKDFPKRDLEIVGLMPNPKGSDLEGEFVEIRNNYKKNINLKGYFLATGKDEKSLVNHTINEDLKIGPGDVEKVERDICKLTLPNKEGVVELRYPNKKNADMIRYSKEKIEEDEKYVLVDGVWTWILPASPGMEDETRIAGVSNPVIGDSAAIFPKIRFADLAQNKNKAMCQCLARVITENWFARNERWLSLIASIS